jgi:excisionase family DNA binding protein
VKIELEQSDIEGIAEKVTQLLLPKLCEVIGNGACEDELLTVAEAATLLQRSEGQVYQWVHSARHGLSDFPFLKQGKQLRFSRKALMNWKSSEGGRMRR